MYGVMLVGLLLACAQDPSPETFVSAPGTAADPATHRILGTSEDGTKLALVLEVEAAPQKNEVVVLEAGAERPLLRARAHDDAAAQRVLRDHGIHAKPPPSATGRWPQRPASDAIISGYVEVPPSPVAFTIEPEVRAGDADCDGMSWSVATGDRVARAPALGNGCVRDVALREVYRGRDALWFVTVEHTERGEGVGVVGVEL